MLKRIKQIVSLILCAAMILTVVPTMALSVSAADESLTDGDFRYKILEDGTACLTYYTGSASSVTTPKTVGGRKVTQIGLTIFWENNTVKTVTVSEGVESIVYYAFKDAIALTKITLPSTVKEISGGFAARASRVKSFAISKNNPYFTVVDGVLFNKDKTELVAYPAGKTATSYTVPSTVKRIADYAFERNYNLQKITFPKALTDIGDYAFAYSYPLKTVSLKDGLRTIGEGAFGGTSIASITIPGSVETISTSAFGGCKSLKKVTIKNGVKTIGKGAFYRSGLETIKIPASVTKIHDQVFLSTSLKAIYVATDNPVYTDVDGVLFNKAQTTLIQYPQERENEEYILPSSVTTIKTYAFYYVSNLHMMKVSTTLKKVEESAFYGCYSLNTVLYPGYYQQWETIKIGKNNESFLNSWDYSGGAPKITKQPASVAVALGKTAKATVTASGTGLKYQWYYKNPGDSTYKRATGFTGKTYSVAMTSARAGRSVYCVVTSSKNSLFKVQTKAVVLDKKVAITTQPKSVGVASGKTAKVTVKADGSELTYKWYYKDKGASSYKVATSMKGDTYSVAMTKARSGRKVYCLITDVSGNKVKSNVVTIGLNAKITAQPKSVAVASGKTAKVTVKADGVGLKYQWYYKDKGSSTYKKATSFKSASYSVAMTKARAGRKVYCLITDEFGNKIKSNVVTLSMK